MRILSRWLAMPALLAAITAGFHWRLTLTRQFSWLERPEAVRVMPWLDIPARDVHAHRLPLWNPYPDGGAPLLGAWGPATANPLNWILFAQPLRDGHIRLGVFHVYWVLLHWLASLCLYALCRELGIGRAGAVFGAAVYGLGGSAGGAWSPAWLIAAAWVPAVLLAWLRARDGARPLAAAAACGAALGMAWLSGEPEVPAALTLAWAILWVAACTAAPRRAAAPALVSATVALLVPALQWLPAREWPSGVWGFDWRTLPGLVTPGWTDSYLGVTAVLFALAGACAAWRRPEMRWLPVLAVIGFAVPWRGAPVVGQAVLCALAAGAVDAGIAARGSRWARRLLVAAGAACFAVYTVSAVARWGWDDRPLLAALLGLLLAVLLYVREQGGVSSTAAAACALSLALLETGAVLGPAMPETGRKDSRLTLIREQADLARFLHAQPDWFRVEADPRDIPYPFGEWYGIDQAGGSAEARGRLGVRFVLARKPPRADLVDLFESNTGVKVFRDRKATSPLRAEYASPCAVPADLRLEDRDNRSLVVAANLGCRATLVAAARCAPGWRTWIDRRPAQLVAAPGGLCAVQVEVGTHRIEFRYRPLGVYAGAGLTLLGFGLAAALWRRALTRPGTAPLR